MPLIPGVVDEDVIEHDTGGMAKLAGDLGDVATSFSKTIEDLYTELGKRLTAEKSDESYWWGPRATNALSKFNLKKTDFETATSNITNFSSSLDEQAVKWNDFETKI